MSYKMLLSMSADAKTIKGQKFGYLTGILYLTPADGSEFGNVCPFALLAGCDKPCLNTAGRGAFNNVQLARLAKTELWFNDRAVFFNHLCRSIRRVIARSKRLGLTPVIRLNGTSDLQWELHSFVFDSVIYKNIFAMFPDVQFYDYTKIPTRHSIPANYDLTFSYSGVKTFLPVYQKAKLNPVFKRFAVVFDKAINIPDSFDSMPVMGGDDSDLRFLDGAGVVALYAKGKAKKDTTGFVVRPVSLVA